jgi:3-oxoacyl-[acyl-carrier protein] reductase
LSSGPLKGRVSLVTGSSRGIGRAIALKLASMGSKVVVTYRKRKEDAQEVVKSIEEMGSEAVAVQVDMGYPEQVERLASQALEAMGRVDILVNNAGVGFAQPFHRARVDLLLREISVNLVGALILTRALLPGMLERRWGRIINVTSVAGIQGGLFLVGYSSAKAGLIGFTKALAAEVADSGVTVNAVAPGFVATKLGLSYFYWLEEVLGIRDAREKYLRAVPPHRFVTEEEVAEVVGFLASPAASGINGEVIIVDAGAVLAPGYPPEAVDVIRNRRGTSASVDAPRRT